MIFDLRAAHCSFKSLGVWAALTAIGICAVQPRAWTEFDLMLNGLWKKHQSANSLQDTDQGQWQWAHEQKFFSFIAALQQDSNMYVFYIFTSMFLSVTVINLGPQSLHVPVKVNSVLFENQSICHLLCTVFSSAFLTFSQSSDSVWLVTVVATRLSGFVVCCPNLWSGTRTMTHNHSSEWHVVVFLIHNFDWVQTHLISFQSGLKSQGRKPDELSDRKSVV